MLFSELLSSCNFGELDTRTVVQSAAFCNVQGCNSATKTGDISNVKYNLSTSYKYKIPRSLCNLYVFQRYFIQISPPCWKMGARQLPRPGTRFCRQPPSLCRCPAPRMLVWGHRLLPASFPPNPSHPQGPSRSCGGSWGVRVGAQLCRVPAHLAGARCHCASAAEPPQGQFLGCEL